MEIFSPRFTVGWLILTPGALFALVEAQEDPKSFLSRHMQGDWGDVDPALWAANQYAVRHGERLLSVYHTRHGRTLWVTTEASRYATTILLPGTSRTKGERMKTVAAVNAEASKLDQLASTWGMSVPELIETYAIETQAPGICMNPSCTYSSEVEPDQRKGWCEECETTSVTSALILAGII